MNLVEFIQTIEQAGKMPGRENYFRGHSDKSFELKPSVYRNGLIENEDAIFKEAIVRTPHEFQHHRSTCEKLVKMQHYGIPTRMLDITSNPLVALYFASCEPYHKDGEVIFFQVPADHIKYYDSDAVSALSNIARRPKSFVVDFEKKGSVKAFNQRDDMPFLHHDIKEEKAYFQEIIDRNDMQDIFVVKAKMDNARILKQQGLFMIFGITGPKTEPAIIPPSWLLNQNDKEVKIIIKSVDKRHILTQLNAIGINRSTLFPEIEYQGRHLIDTYRTDRKSG